MSVPTITSPYRLQLNPAWAAVNTLTPSKIYARLPAAPATASNLGDIWAGSSLASPILTRTLPAAQFTLGVVSDSTSDNTGQTGALSVSVDYLDVNYLPASIIIPLTGQSIASSAITNCLRVQGAQVVSAGSGGSNVGNIYVVDVSTLAPSGVPSTTTKVFAVIAPGYNTDLMGMFTIPATFQGSVSQVIVDVVNGTATAYNARVVVEVALWVGTAPAGALLPFQRAVIAGPSTAAPAIILRSDLLDNLTAGSEIRFRASSTGAGAEIALICELVLSKGNTSGGNP